MSCMYVLNHKNLAMAVCLMFLRVYLEVTNWDFFRVSYSRHCEIFHQQSGIR